MAFRALRRKLLLGGLIGGGAVGAALVVDANTYGRVTRNLDCLGAAAYTLFHFKVLFDEEKQDETHEKIATLWEKLCARNGGMYIKLAQGIASMNHVLPHQYQKHLGMLQDKAPFVAFPKIERVLEEEFGSSWRALFRSFDTTPVASASIAQVHRAELVDGTKVAIKVQKPEIAKQIKWDMWCYKVVVWFFEKTFGLPVYWTVEKTVPTILREADFRIEAESTERTGRDIEEGGLGTVAAVPKVYWDMTTKRVLTSEWIDGVKITDSEGLKSLNLDVSKVVTTMVEVFAMQLFVSGFLHCDPHPGNIFVRTRKDRNGNVLKGKHQVVILDHGMYMELSEQFRYDYARLWKAMVLLDSETLKSIVSSWGIGDPEFFASLQMFKPYKPEKGPQHLQNTAVADVREMHLSAKEKLRTLLLDSRRTPRELVLVGRHMNLVRASNKHHGSPVNRINVMAKYAAIGVTHKPKLALATTTTTGEDDGAAAMMHHQQQQQQQQQVEKDKEIKDERSWWAKRRRITTTTTSANENNEAAEDKDSTALGRQVEVLVFQSRLFMISFFYYLSQFWRTVHILIGLGDIGGFEEQMEKHAQSSIEERFGIKINIEDDGTGFG